MLDQEEKTLYFLYNTTQMNELQLKAQVSLQVCCLFSDGQSFLKPRSTFGS